MPDKVNIKIKVHITTTNGEKKWCRVKTKLSTSSNPKKHLSICFNCTMIILACTSVIHINFSHNIINYVTYVIAYIYHIIILNSQSQINLARVTLKQRCSSLHRRHHDQFSWSGILVSYQHSCLKLF